MSLSMKCNVEFVGYNIKVSQRRNISDGSVFIAVN
jgi:hypothetical protein